MNLKYLKASLSVFLLFHVTVIVLYPNSDQYVGTLMKPLMEPYAQFFELTNRWSFFAPEPGPPPVFVEYELLRVDGEVAVKGRFPEEKSPFLLRDRQNRRIASTEFMMPGEDRVEKVMVPWLCGNHPGVDSVKLWRVSYQIPEIEEVASGKRRIGDDVNMDKKFVSHSYCADALKEGPKNDAEKVHS